ncbi:MAG: GAF domain-containing sensor histidine kinase, partial [Anaerolineales bacterium]|nr:GAF domain-containing sensor histidine kinase [Anaerolineales bacterium]
GIIPPCDKVHILPDGTLVGQAELASMPRRILYESDEPGSGDRLRNVMSVPLVSGDRPLGALMLVDKTVGTFGPADERLLNSLAATAVIGLDNARLYAQAEETSRLQERQRIAQALHDTIAQMLFSIGLEVKKAQALPQIDDSTRSALNTIGRLSERSSHELRNAILALRRPEYETGHNLLRLVQDQVDEFRAKSGIAATLLAPLELETLSPPVNEAIYRVVGEALANVYKHSKASVVVIGLHLEDDWITVTIQDDGVGLDDLATALPDEDDLRFGIATMRQIVEQARGEFLINNNDDGGVTVRVRLPITIKVET